MDNLDWWYKNGLLDKSRDAITRKCGTLCLTFDDPADQSTSSFVDCNCLETPKVLHGPAEPGKNALRWDPHVAEAFYNGWKSMNGLKHQTLESAFGLVIDLFGPMSLRRNDMRLLGLSGIIDKFEEMQLNRDESKGILKFRGDSAYPNIRVVQSYLKTTANGPPLTERSKLENSVYKSVRESIEWSYGSTAAKFKYLTNLEKLQVMKGTKTLKVYTVATILRNIHVILYGSQTSNYFEFERSDLPTLEDYLRQT
jgi:hypothetical protein